jgi:hypothetical protein
MALVGDNDRERAALELRRQYVAGRLSDSELDDRLHVALRARSRIQLVRAVAQLPARSQIDVLAPAVPAAVERVRHALLVAVVAVVWLMASATIFVGFLVWVAATGATTGGLVGFPLVWAILSLLLYRRTRRP